MGISRSSPLSPYIFLPMPASPRRACQWCRPEKLRRVFLLGSATKMTSPPRPPSPPSGPPLGMYFSRRNETQPSPPSPAFTWISASSTNMGGTKREDVKREGQSPPPHVSRLQLFRLCVRELRRRRQPSARHGHGPCGPGTRPCRP